MDRLILIMDQVFICQDDRFPQDFPYLGISAFV